MKYTQTIIWIFLLVFTGFQKNIAQTIIKPGEVDGKWTKKASPYIIKGDINIPEGKTLEIQQGVKVQFDGNFVINVQGNLIAEGKEKDSICFTIADTTSINGKQKYGWGGIRFDRRPVSWDTLRFKMPENEEAKKIVQERIDNGQMDTTTKIRLVLQVTDLVNDTVVTDSVFLKKAGSRLAFCRMEYGLAGGKRQPYVFGGAVYIYRYSNLVITNCVFEKNRAYAGGAIYCKESAPVILHNTIINNWSQSSGGAMVFIHSGAIVTNNTISKNKSGHNGGAMLFYESTPYVTANIMTTNFAYSEGGGIFCEKNLDNYFQTGELTPVEKYKFKRDSTFEESNLTSLLIWNATSSYGRFNNNVICNNKAQRGGGIGLSATAPEFTNNTISNNIADTAGGGFYCYMSSPEITNSIIYANSDYENSQIYLTGSSYPVINYCNIESGISGIKKDSVFKGSIDYSNITNFDPDFENSGENNYALKSESKCIDAGKSDTVSLGLLTTDIKGNNRIYNRVIDLGALEFNGQDNNKKTELKTTYKSGEINPEGDTSEEMYAVVYPNPTSGAFSVTIHNNKYTRIGIRVYTREGKLEFSNEYAAGGWFEVQADLTGKAPGIYIVVVHSDETILYNGEIIIE